MFRSLEFLRVPLKAFEKVPRYLGNLGLIHHKEMAINMNMAKCE